MSESTQRRGEHAYIESIRFSYTHSVRNLVFLLIASLLRSLYLLFFIYLYISPFLLAIYTSSNLLEMKKVHGRARPRRKTGPNDAARHVWADTRVLRVRVNAFVRMHSRPYSPPAVPRACPSLYLSRSLPFFSLLTLSSYLPLPPYRPRSRSFPRFM